MTTYRQVIFVLVKGFAFLTGVFFGVVTAAATLDQLTQRGWGYHWSDAAWGLVGCIGSIIGISIVGVIQRSE